MKKQFFTFIIRWIVNTLALWACASILHFISSIGDVYKVLIAALVLSILNAIVKPILIIFTLPAIALSLGFFLIVINGFVVYLTSVLYKPLKIDSFWTAVLVGIVMSLLNYIVTVATDLIGKENA
jgi:putative membrane protein